MLKKVIEKALLLRNVEKKQEVVIETSVTTVFSLHLSKMIVLLLYNFFLFYKVTELEVTILIKDNYADILNIIMTEIKIGLHNYIILYEEELENLIEFHNKDETLLVLAIQENVNKNLKELFNLEEKK